MNGWNELDLDTFPETPSSSYVEAIGQAQRGILKMDLLIADLRVKRHMTAIISVVTAVGCLIAFAFGIAEADGARPPVAWADASTLIWCGAGLLLVIGVTIPRRLAATKVMIDGLRHQRMRLEAALDKAEEDAAKLTEPMAIAILWMGDTQVAIAGGATPEEADAALIAANPGMTEAQRRTIERVNAAISADGTWSAIVDGN